MNIAQLRTFVAVVENGSFSAAARVLGLSQPAVTMQIQSLEADVGATVLDRRYRRVELTEAGRVLLPHARDVLEQVELAHDEIAGLSETVSGRLLISASTTPGQYILPRLLGAFVKQYPEVGVTLEVRDTADVVEAVAAGEAHLGMTGAELPGARVESERLGRDRLLLICPTDSPLLGSSDAPLSRVAEQPFIARESGSGTRMTAEKVLREAGIDPGDLNVVLELGTGEAVVSAVEGGMGVAVVSEHVAEKALKLGTVAEIADGHFPVERPLYVVTPRGTLTRAARAFRDFLRERL